MHVLSLFIPPITELIHSVYQVTGPWIVLSPVASTERHDTRTNGSLSWPKGPTVSLLVDLGPPGWPGLPPVVSFRETYLAQSYGCFNIWLSSCLSYFLPSPAYQRSPTDMHTFTCSSCWHHRHMDLCALWSPLQLLAPQADRPLWSSSSCWYFNLHKHTHAE